MARSPPRSIGRRVFGRGARGYDQGRLGYPPELYALLRDRCGLGSASRVLEAGAGTGIASAELLRAGAGTLTAVEVDPKMAAVLREKLRATRSRSRVVVGPFEDVALGPQDYDLVVAASCVHWMDRRRMLEQVLRTLTPGGWFACWGNSHGDASRPNAWERASDPVFRRWGGPRHAPPPNRRAGSGRRPHDLADIERALRRSGAFDRVTYRVFRRSVRLPTGRLMALYRTFSDVRSLPPGRRRSLLAELEKLAQERFGGEVSLRVRSPALLARVRPSRARRGRDRARGR